MAHRRPRARSLAHGEAKIFRLFASLTPTSMALLESQSEATGLSRSEILERLIRATEAKMLSREDYRQCIQAAIARDQLAAKILALCPPEEASAEQEQMKARIAKWHSLLGS